MNFRTPSTTTGLLTYYASKYWEIWLENDDGAFQTDVKFHYDNLGGIGDEANLKLYTRSNASGIWSEVSNYTVISNDGASSSNTDGIGYILVNDLTSFSQFIITSSDGDNNALPVSLLDFQASCNDNKTIELNWTTASEINNSHFEIQQSLDAENFITIDRVEGAGNSNVILNYKSIVENNENIQSYYRLKQIDFDGKFEYSKIIAVDCSDKGLNSIKIYPNPFTNEISIDFNNILKSSVKVEVRNKLGILIKEVVIEANNSINKIVLPKNLPSGIYFVVISNEKEIVVKKILKE